MKNKTTCLKIITWILSFLFFTGGISSCKKSDAAAASTVTVGFKKDIIPIFKSSCSINSNCHLGASNINGQVNLDSAAAYTTIINKRLVNAGNPGSSSLYEQVNNGIMPKAPYPALTTGQINLIYNWILQGASNN